MKSSYQVVFSLILLCLRLSSGEIVSTSDGQIEGTVMNSRLGVNFHAFLRVPFAEPPIGDLRFKDPQPNKPWTDVRNGTYFGPMCMQANARADYKISEDCLHLNIYSKSLTDSKPVIFFVHGGSYVTGTGLSEGPHYLMDRDLVVVTINYRLGALGFLATGTKEAPGNAGLKDQAMALKWVHQNIARFGGDPNKITINGLSAGASSVTALMLSPMVKDLFTGVIAVSGSIVGLNPLRSEYLDLAEKLSTNLTCTTDKVEDMIDCLRTKHPLDIVNIRLYDYPECQIVSWRPVVEPDFGQERFFADDPLKIIRGGNFPRVPIIIGRTANEFINLVPRLLNSPGLKTMNENFDDIAPYCFLYERNTEKSKAIGKVLREAYLPFDTIDIRSFDGLNKLFGDSIIGYSVHRFAHLAAHFTDVYYYKFSYVGRHSVFNYPHDDKPYGVHHADDLQYAFNVDYIGDMIQVSDPENFMVERMTNIYEHFAHTGNPNYDPDNMNWPKLNNETELYMDIGTHMVEKHGMFLERYTLWDRLETSSANSIKFGIILILVLAVKLICF